MGRSPCCPKEGVNRGAWSAQEDEILTSYIKTHGEGKWRDLPKRAGLRRCGKSCRLRWLNYLRPDIKRGNISSEEEDLIVRLHNLLGNRWSLIAGRLPGRTDNEIKNYWNTCLGKRMKAQPTIEDDLGKKKQSTENSSEHEPHEQRKATSCTEQDTELGLPEIPSLLSPENNHDLNFPMDFDLEGQSGPADMLDYYNNYMTFFGDETDHVIDSTSFDHHLQFSEAELDNWKAVGNLIPWSSKCWV